MKTDTFRTQVYYVEALDRFEIFDYRARPGEGSRVVVEQDGLDATTEQFCGQPFIAVVSPVEFYPLENSEQHTPPRNWQPEAKPKKPRKRVYWPRRLAC